MRPAAPNPPVTVPLTEMRDGAAPPQPEEVQGHEAAGEATSSLGRLRDFLLSLLWP